MNLHRFEAMRHPKETRPKHRVDKWMVQPNSRAFMLWNLSRMLFAVYSVVTTPLFIVFSNTRFAGSMAAGLAIDILFLAGVVVRMRTPIMLGGELVYNSNVVAKNYLQAWFAYDLVSSLPVEPVVSAIAAAAGASSDTLEALMWLQLLRSLRVREIIYQFRKLSGANVVRVVQMLAGFLVFAHYLGCFWYALVIWPLQRAPRVQSMHEWMWNDETPYDTATLYVCALYWALGVMTNLKGWSAHESRQCFWRDPLVIRPLQERTYSIMVFIVGATFYSIIYGNIGQFVANLYQSGLRYKRRIAEIDEFIKFHGLSDSLGTRIRKYVDFAFSVTKGINVDAVASQLPPHLMLEVYLQLNRQMVGQVSIFEGCTEDFLHAVVMKLQPSICTQGDYVFYRGETGERMYFIKRGRVQVIINDAVVHTFIDTGYFGEIALIADAPRTADLKCITNCMLLSLSTADLESIFGTYPQSRAVFIREAQKRLSLLEKVKDDQLPPSGANCSKPPSLDAATVITGPKSIARKSNLSDMVKEARTLQATTRRFSAALASRDSRRSAMDDAANAANAVKDITDDDDDDARHEATANAMCSMHRRAARLSGEEQETSATTAEEPPAPSERTLHSGGAPDDSLVGGVRPTSAPGLPLDDAREGGREGRERHWTTKGGGSPRSASPPCGRAAVTPVGPAAASQNGSPVPVPVPAGISRDPSPSKTASPLGMRAPATTRPPAGRSIRSRAERFSHDVLRVARLTKEQRAPERSDRNDRNGAEGLGRRDGWVPPNDEGTQGHAQELPSAALPSAAMSMEGARLHARKMGRDEGGNDPLFVTAAVNAAAAVGAHAPEAPAGGGGGGAGGGGMELQLSQLMLAVGELAREAQRSKRQQERQQLQLQQTVETQQQEMRQSVETLVTQVNDISRTLTEASRSQSRWM